MYLVKDRYLFKYLDKWMYVRVYISRLFCIYCLILHGKCFFGNNNLNFICKVVFPLKVLGNISHDVFDDLVDSVITRNQEDCLAHFGSVIPFCTPVKTPENLRFSCVFREYKMGTLAIIGLS